MILMPTKRPSGRTEGKPMRFSLQHMASVPMDKVLKERPHLAADPWGLAKAALRSQGVDPKRYRGDDRWVLRRLANAAIDDAYGKYCVIGTKGVYTANGKVKVFAGLKAAKAAKRSESARIVLLAGFGDPHVSVASRILDQCPDDPALADTLLEQSLQLTRPGKFSSGDRQRMLRLAA
jgi:hypothetical protein